MRKIGLIIIVLIFLAVFYSLAMQTYNSLQAARRFDQEAAKLAKLQQQNNELKKQLTEAQTPQFTEEQARNKLNLSRPGETVFIIPPSELSRVLGIEDKPIQVQLPNWQGWLKLFWR